jgi:hypothetical protein
MTLSDFHNRLLGDTLCIVVGIFKQNFKVKCESRNTKAITWRYTSINNIIYENMLILTARILWRATRISNILLVTENRRRHKYMVWRMLTWLIVDSDMTCSGLWRGMLRQMKLLVGIPHAMLRKFLKQIFKVQCESTNTKVISWKRFLKQHYSWNHDNCWERTILNYRSYIFPYYRNFVACYSQMHDIKSWSRT